MNKEIEKAKKVKGSMLDGDLLVLFNLTKDVPENGLIVEIGCYYGKSTSLLYYSKKESVILFTIDTFTGTERDQSKNQYCRMINNMVLYEFYPRIIYGSSRIGAANLFKEDSIDLLFIDGWHTKDEVMTDIGSFLDKVKDGAVICGHDWTTYEGVRQGVLSFWDRSKIKTYESEKSSIWSIQI